MLPPERTTRTQHRPCCRWCRRSLAHPVSPLALAFRPTAGGLDELGGEEGVVHSNRVIPNESEGEEVAARSQARLMVAAALSYPPPPHTYGPIVVVSSYTQFGDLAHGPRGTEATRAVRTYRLNIVDGSLTLLSMVAEGAIHNPAFSRVHPKLNVMYMCTESVKTDGLVVALALDGKTGALREHCPPAGAGGTSTCYLTIHPSCRRMLAVNYVRRRREAQTLDRQTRLTIRHPHRSRAVRSPCWDSGTARSPRSS